ncbi:MAG: hypothetical protein CLLPBCKN_008425 [Chroococcidiopsis cubana SAG 39.79]|nr:hypothetical protein [Chroococcidiopsis cubana SAG 39.79]
MRYVQYALQSCSTNAKQPSRLSYWSKSPRAFLLCKQPAQATHHSEEWLSKERVRVTSAALAILGRADSLIPDDSMMEKYRKLIKRQRPEKTEESADSRARISSLDQAAQPIKSPEAPVEEQAIDEIVEVPSSRLALGTFKRIPIQLIDLFSVAARVEGD